MIGDGALPNPGPEKILEAYYTVAHQYVATHIRLSIHHQSGLQSRPRAGIGSRDTFTHAILKFPANVAARRNWTAKPD